jgi:hypothetical protein
MRPNEKHRLRCTDCGAIQIVRSNLKYVRPCPECYSSKCKKVTKPKEPPVTSSAAVSQDIEYYHPAQKVIRVACRRFLVSLQAFELSLNSDQEKAISGVVDDLINFTQNFERTLEGLGLPLEFKQEDR